MKFSWESTEIGINFALSFSVIIIYISYNYILLQNFHQEIKLHVCFEGWDTVATSEIPCPFL